MYTLVPKRKQNTWRIEKIYIYKGKASRTKQLPVLHNETIYMFDTQEIFINTEK